jgi:formylglycine-generating enzyme
MLVACGRVRFEPTGDARTADATLACSATCGATRDQSCCDRVSVPAGVYLRSFDNGVDGAFMDMSAPAMISEFRLDVHEITVGRFRAFVADGGGTRLQPPSVGAGAHPLIANSGWNPAWNTELAIDTTQLIAAVQCDSQMQTWSELDADANKPMNCLTWYEAFAFCAWDGGYVPTEAQWNYAATGGDEQRAFPWSQPASVVTFDASQANALLHVAGDLPAGNGRWGHADLTANVWEWVLDWYEPIYPTPCTDCAVTIAGTDARRILRGGSYLDPPMLWRTAFRNPEPTLQRAGNIGARCAYP